MKEWTVDRCQLTADALSALVASPLIMLALVTRSVVLAVEQRQMSSPQRKLWGERHVL